MGRSSGDGEYIHICSRCGGYFYTDEWYIGAYPLCPVCRADELEVDRLAPRREFAADTAERLAAKEAADAERERQDREYEANPPKVVVTVAKGMRVERRGVVPAGANAGRGSSAVLDGTGGFS